MSNESNEVLSLQQRLFYIQSELKNPKKSSKGYNYNYANLESVMEIVKPLLITYNILLIQSPVFDGELVGVKTKLICIDNNDYLTNEFMSKPVKGDCQGIGSLLTYYRRYALLCLFNLVPEDDDGNDALETPREIKSRWR
jgi:hypothetical protein